MAEQIGLYKFEILLGIVGLISLMSFIFISLQRSQMKDMARQQQQLSEQVIPMLQKMPIELQLSSEQQFADVKMKIMRQQADFQQQFANNQMQSFDNLHQTLNRHAKENREELANSLAKNIASLTETTDKRLTMISEQVEKRLADGFDKTTKTFNDILKRLALIDDAQQKITELSTNVVSLQEVLADKRSRGAFGEVQLNSLIRNVLPEEIGRAHV